MKINLKVWRQKHSNSQGKFKTYQVDYVLEDKGDGGGEDVG